ncbi:hypothetical protein QC823_07470 [Halomonas vilamensis]|uniref:Uncharacterized protein n=1 Tax=Vreelandella vilamensis TaxID=531309 RepID=A0ABU1H3F0_9GAMM|nr:hypothetical protein [Halomonas vilamensis]MDR5898826.1 hypothetical protein [Halomonas vilamensis]
MQTRYRWLKSAVIATYVVALSGCGTLFYPERKGQMSGNVDPVVAIANGVGLLFFIVPGVIAYAVDFSNGTIYLPNQNSASIDVERLQDVNDVVALETLLSQKAGQPVRLDNELLMVEEVESLDVAMAMVRMSGVLDDEKLATM